MDDLLPREQFEALAERLLRLSTADQTEVVAIGVDSSLTRFANSEIHQNVGERNVEIRVRALVGKRAGVATSNDLSEESLSRLSSRAIEAAKRQPEGPELPDLVRPSAVQPVDAFVAETANCTPEQRARLVGVVCRLANEARLKASGACTTETTTVGLANSNRVRFHEVGTRAGLLTVVLDDEGSGYAEQMHRNVREIDAEALGREAVDKGVRTRNAERVEPGEYPVVLEAYAVAETLNYLSYMGFGGLSLLEGTSFFRGRVDQQVVDPRISVWDDAREPRCLPSAFDFEGTPRQRVDLIRNGVAAGVVHDRRTAARAGTESTGHALPAPNTFGPFASHLIMAPGNTPEAKLAEGIERGIWVTRFHYVNVVKSDQAVLTGLTRDGTFLIEHGEVTRPIKNLRFTQGILDAWSGLGALGAEQRLLEGWGGAVLAPSMRLGAFRFTGVSDV
jgi:predicted Zn-dependent protease